MEKLLALIRPAWNGGSVKRSGGAWVERRTGAATALAAAEAAAVAVAEAAAPAECVRKSKEESLADAIVELCWESLPEKGLCEDLCGIPFLSNPYLRIFAGYLFSDPCPRVFAGYHFFLILTYGSLRDTISF